MKSAHEVLLDLSLERRSQERETFRRGKLLSAANPGFLAIAFPLILFFALMLVAIFILVISPTKSLASGSGLFIALALMNLGTAIGNMVRRDRALRELIRQDAPRLSQELANRVKPTRKFPGR